MVEKSFHRWTSFQRKHLHFLAWKSGARQIPFSCQRLFLTCSNISLFWNLEILLQILLRTLKIEFGMHVTSKQWFLNFHVRIFRDGVLFCFVFNGDFYILRFKISKAKMGPRSAFKAPSTLAATCPSESGTHGHPRRISLNSK